MKLVKAQYSREEVQELLRRAVSQDREFQARVLQNLPLPDENVQQGWIDNPRSLQRVLASTLSPLAVYKTADTNLSFSLGKCQEFAKKYLGVEFDFARFAIPAELPWDSVIPVFDPGNLTNRQAVDKALKGQNFNVWEEVDVMNYSGSKANKEPTLHFIQNSVEPDEDTTNQSSDQLVAAGKSWLSQRGYALAFGLHYFVIGEYLDPRTWTWFPNNRLSSSRVARGYWDPVGRWVRFDGDSSGYGGDSMGARLAMPVSLRS